MKSNRFFFIPVLMVLMVACNQNRHAKIGGSVDTTSIKNAGDPPIADTSTISANEKKNGNTQKQNATVKDTVSSRGNADPSGRMNKSNAQKP